MKYKYQATVTFENDTPLLVVIEVKTKAQVLDALWKVLNDKVDACGLPTEIKLLSEHPAQS